MPHSWNVVDGDVIVPVDEAEWWGSSLAILVAALHHPQLLAAQQPATDAAVVGRQVLSGLDELRHAALGAKSACRNEDGSGSRGSFVLRDGDKIVFSPGAEVGNLALCLEIFALAVLNSASPEASIARGATAYAASAWSRDIGKASGCLR